MKYSLVILLVLVCATACSVQGTPSPTPSNTPIPSKTPTLRPTAAATKTPVPVEMGQRINIGDLFSLQPVKGYQYEIDGNVSVFLSNITDDVTFNIIFLDSKIYGPLPAHSFFSYLIQGFSDFSDEELASQFVGGLEFTILSITGNEDNLGDFEGFYAEHTLADESQIFFLAQGLVAANQNAWQAEGIASFEAILGSLELGPSSEVGMECNVTTDASYGYMEDNPVRVGGGGSLTDLSFDGPDREKAFLNTLRAPNGDPVTFERAGSMGSGDTILDIYLIKASGFNGEKTVYIDMYNFSELFAPVGFSCGGRFTISEP